MAKSSKNKNEIKIIKSIIRVVFNSTSSGINSVNTKKNRLKHAANIRQKKIIPKLTVKIKGRKSNKTIVIANT